MLFQEPAQSRLRQPTPGNPAPQKPCSLLVLHNGISGKNGFIGQSEPRNELWHLTMLDTLHGGVAHDPALEGPISGPS